MGVLWLYQAWYPHSDIMNVDPGQVAKLSGEVVWMADSPSVALSEESPVVNTLCTFFIALVPTQVELVQLI